MINGEYSRERKFFILAAILFLNLVLVSTHIVLDGERTLFQTVTGGIISPFQIAFQKSVDYIAHEFNHYIFLKDSFTKYAEIKRKYKRLQYENYKLRIQLEDYLFQQRVKEHYNDFVAAEVISIDRNFPLESLMINKGSGDGIEKNMIVLNEAGELVGKIVEPISPFAAKVRLITSSIDGVGAYLEKDQLEGLITGSNSTLCHFKYLIENKPVFKGDRVVTSGTDRIFPESIPIGKVVEVKQDYLQQNVSVRPFFIEKSIKQLIVIPSPYTQKGPPPPEETKSPIRASEIPGNDG